MKISDLQFDNFRGYLLKRISLGEKGEQYYRAKSLAIFSIWKQEVKTKLGDVEIREERHSSNQSFVLTF